MTIRSRFLAPLTALVLAAGCTSTAMNPSAPAADRTGTAGSAGAMDARQGSPGQRMQERGAPGAPRSEAPMTGEREAQMPPPVAQQDGETLRACMTYRQMMAGKTPLEQQQTWALHLQQVHGIGDPQEAAMHQRNVERTCAAVMPG